MKNASSRFVLWRVPLALSVAFALFGCSPPTGSAEVVAVSVEPLRYLVDNLSGGAVEVVVAVPSGASPTTYVPTDAEMVRLRRAISYFSAGVPMERGSWFAAVVGGEGLVDLREGIRREQPASADPHTWLSPRRLSIMAATVAERLRALRPARATAIEVRLEVLQRELEELDAELTTRLEPYRGRVFLVYHPSWGHFADDYGLRQMAVETAGQEPSDAELAMVRDVVTEHGLRCLFVQPQIHGRSAERLAVALGLQRVIIDPLAGDLPENLRQVTSALVRSWSEGEQ
jgi:zinc transport system substrate-binding protein